MYCRRRRISNIANGPVRSRCENRRVESPGIRIAESRRRRTGGGLALVLVLLVSGCASDNGGNERGERKQRAAGSEKPERIQMADKGRNQVEGGHGGGADKADDTNGAVTPAVAALLQRLRVSPEVEVGYDRDLFDHWDDRGACDVRDLVLARQDRRKGPCGSESGRWFSVYDGVMTTDPGEFDIDHMVPLAEAWASGARRWPEQRREAFANDLHPYSLIAVSASSNRSKSDRDPAEWMPENDGFACAYVARWVAVKARWSLSIDPREKAFLKREISGCRPAELRPNGKAGETG